MLHFLIKIWVILFYFYFFAESPDFQCWQPAEELVSDTLQLHNYLASYSSPSESVQVCSVCSVWQSDFLTLTVRKVLDVRQVVDQVTVSHIGCTVCPPLHVQEQVSELGARKNKSIVFLKVLSVTTFISAGIFDLPHEGCIGAEQITDRLFLLQGLLLQLTL